MLLIWRRYSRSGYASGWYYAVIGVGFAALAVWAGVQRDWLVLAIAVVMLPVTAAGAALMRRLRASLAASKRAVERREEQHG